MRLRYQVDSFTLAAMQRLAVTNIDRAIAAISALRTTGARVHCITNTVAQPLTANVLLACGATPSMTVAPEEAAEFTARSDALLVNLGTLDQSRREAITASLNKSAETGIPVVLDPVKCEMSPLRAALAREILAGNRIILKANQAEQAALGDVEADCRITTGATDIVARANSMIRVENGHPLMDRVVALGCALGALVVALVARSETPADGALAALIWFGAAGELAAEKAQGPGSFEPEFLDALHGMSEDEIMARARIS